MQEERWISICSWVFVHWVKANVWKNGENEREETISSRRISSSLGINSRLSSRWWVKTNDRDSRYNLHQRESTTITSNVSSIIPPRKEREYLFQYLSLDCWFSVVQSAGSSTRLSHLVIATGCLIAYILQAPRISLLFQLSDRLTSLSARISF